MVFDVQVNDEIVLQKFAAVTQSMNHPKTALHGEAQKILNQAIELGFQNLMEAQNDAWKRIWETADIVIEGDVKAQQAIRFNIFQLNQTYTGDDARLNIGPKDLLEKNTEAVPTGILKPIAFLFT